MLVLQMVLACLLNRGDPLLCDEYTYSHLVEAMMGPKGYTPVPVPMDDFGMTAKALQQVCSVSTSVYQTSCASKQNCDPKLVLHFLWTHLPGDTPVPVCVCSHLDCRRLCESMVKPSLYIGYAGAVHDGLCLVP